MCSYGKLRIMLNDGETEYNNKEAARSCEVKRNSYCSYMTYSLVVTLRDTDPKSCTQVGLICVAFGLI